jgi:hypothetical protein
MGAAMAAVGALALVAAVHGPLRGQDRAMRPPAQNLFEKSQDLGTVLHPGTTEFNAERRTYTLTASGENIWGTQDAFQFAWKKMSGDVELSADISFNGMGVNPHRKAVLMIRQRLDADSPYVDAALHGSGLIALQYREAKGGTTTEIETMASVYNNGLPVATFFRPTAFACVPRRCACAS